MIKGLMIVLAGNSRQADDFIRDQPSDEYKYIYADSPQQVRSIASPNVVKVGAYYEHEDYIFMRDILNSRRARFGKGPI